MCLCMEFPRNVLLSAEGSAAVESRLQLSTNIMHAEYRIKSDIEICLAIQLPYAMWSYVYFHPIASPRQWEYSRDALVILDRIKSITRHLYVSPQIVSFGYDGACKASADILHHILYLEVRWYNHQQVYPIIGTALGSIAVWLLASALAKLLVSDQRNSVTFCSCRGVLYAADLEESEYLPADPSWLPIINAGLGASMDQAVSEFKRWLYSGILAYLESKLWTSQNSYYQYTLKRSVNLFDGDSCNHQEQHEETLSTQTFDSKYFTNLSM